MGYKSILTILNDAARADRVIAAAAGITMAQEGHLEVVCLGIDRTQVGYSYMGVTPGLLQIAQDRAEAEAKGVESVVRDALDAQSATLRHSVETAVASIGGVGDLVALRARFADLVVLDRPYGAGRSVEEEAIAEAAMFDGQAPVLILPDDIPKAPIRPKQIVLAWNQSREALTAVRYAMPFLRRAEHVCITIIDPPVHGPERSDPGGALCQMLVRHGVRAEVTVLARTLPRVSDVLMRHVADRNADLLVMGAYGHSRFREAILGGATRNMLEQTTVPVLMAH